jgi:hypothetical protein
MKGKVDTHLPTPIRLTVHFIQQLPKFIQPTMTSTLKTIVAVTGVSLLSTVAASAAVYSQNFDSFANGTTNLGDGSSINHSLGGTNASVQGGALRLTNDLITGENASFILPNVAGASLGWTMTFDVTIIDGDPGTPPADGVSLNWGALTGSLSTNSQGAEHGWNNGDVQLNYQVDTWQNGATDNGFRIASHLTGTEVIHAQQQGIVVNDNSTVTGSVTLSWDPVNGASMSTADFVTNVSFTNVAIPGFAGNEGYLFAFSTRTGFAEETLLIDNVVLTTVPEASSSLMAALAGLGLLSIRRRK